MQSRAQRNGKILGIGNFFRIGGSARWLKKVLDGQKVTAGALHHLGGGGEDKLLAETSEYPKNGQKQPESSWVGLSSARIWNSEQPSRKKTLTNALFAHLYSFFQNFAALCVEIFLIQSTGLPKLISTRHPGGGRSPAWSCWLENRVLASWASPALEATTSVHVARWEQQPGCTGYHGGTSAMPSATCSTSAYWPRRYACQARSTASSGPDWGRGASLRANHRHVQASLGRDGLVGVSGQGNIITYPPPEKLLP